MDNVLIVATLGAFVLGVCISTLITWLVVSSRDKQIFHAKLRLEKGKTENAEDDATQFETEFQLAKVEITKFREAVRVQEIRATKFESQYTETYKQLVQKSSETKELREKIRLFENSYVEASARLKEAEKNVKEQRGLLESAKTQLTNEFGTLASTALGRNTDEFLKLADAKFTALKDSSVSDLDARKVAIETLIKPVSESLVTYQSETKLLEERRLKEIGAVGEQLKSVAFTQLALQAETNKLVTALKSPTVRGRWGEVTLKRSAEIAGMSSYCDF